MLWKIDCKIIIIKQKTIREEYAEVWRWCIVVVGIVSHFWNQGDMVQYVDFYCGNCVIQNTNVVTFYFMHKKLFVSNSKEPEVFTLSSSDLFFLIFHVEICFEAGN